MSNTGKIIIAAVVVVIIAGGAWILASTKNNNSAPNTEQDTTQTESNDQKAAETAATITYGEAGFSPSTLTIKSGQAVKIVNETNQVIKFASDPHPSHTNNPELNSGDILPNGSTTITLTKKGEWGFHNHFDPAMQGTIKVE